jgi:putative DNA methylase
VIFAQMVDDPSAHPDIFPTEKKQEKERQRLFRIIEDLVKWENTTNETVLQQARDEIWQSWRYTCAENADHPRAKELFDRFKLPAFHDPFAGGGALPLEAQRLGLESHASRPQSCGGAHQQDHDREPAPVCRTSRRSIRSRGRQCRVTLR